MSNLFEKDIDARFAEFHAANPHVFILFRTYAQELWNAGHRKGSAELIIQRIRWQTAIETRGDL